MNHNTPAECTTCGGRGTFRYPLPGRKECPNDFHNSYEAERNHNRSHNKLFDLRLSTRVPSKYRVIDLETGDVWQYNPDATLSKTNTGWTRAKDITWSAHNAVASLKN